MFSIKLLIIYIGIIKYDLYTYIIQIYYYLLPKYSTIGTGTYIII